VRLLTAQPQLGALREALRELAIAGDGKRHRTWAVVGPVEGASAEELMDLGRHAVRLDIGVLVVVGAAAPVHAGAVLEGSWGEESRHVQDAEAVVTLLRAALHDDDVVLVAGVPEVLPHFPVAVSGAGDAP
jgi:UDP-N-acetylmuramoyl-tripeptide--D-alanyl-D-alanine ligase